MYPISSDGLNTETENAVYFYTTAFHAFDNFSAHQVELWGQVFPTAEHAYQWHKCVRITPEMGDAILKAPSPEVANGIARAHKHEVTPEWQANKVLVMEEILRAKCAQHEDVRAQLMKTGSRTIIENSPVDSFWGAGANGTGVNHIGKIWMKLRDELSVD